MPSHLDTNPRIESDWNYLTAEAACEDALTPLLQSRLSAPLSSALLGSLPSHEWQLLGAPLAPRCSSVRCGHASRSDWRAASRECLPRSPYERHRPRLNQAPLLTAQQGCYCREAVCWVLRNRCLRCNSVGCRRTSYRCLTRNHRRRSPSSPPPRELRRSATARRCSKGSLCVAGVSSEQPHGSSALAHPGLSPPPRELCVSYAICRH